MSELTLRVLSTGELTDDLRHEIRSWMRDVWGEPGSDSIQWATPEWHVLGEAKGQSVSHAGILRRVIQIGERRVSVGGICAVTTKPSWRGCGYATQILEYVGLHLKALLGVDFGMLECEPDMVSFYSQVGWYAIDDCPICLLPTGRGVVNGHVSMVLECSNRKWPQGPMDLLGLPW